MVLSSPPRVLLYHHLRRPFESEVRRRYVDRTGAISSNRDRLAHASNARQTIFSLRLKRLGPCKMIATDVLKISYRKYEADLYRERFREGNQC
jgi:hypothetical protein